MIHRIQKITFALLLLSLIGFNLQAQTSTEVKNQPPSPLYRDPIYDGAADPVLIYNRGAKEWVMYYTQRLANQQTPGVAFCYGTAIGVATSTDHGHTWVYKGTLKLDNFTGHNTFWAPDVIYDKGVYHMFVVYIKGVRSSWGGDAKLVHYTSTDLWNWKYIGPMNLPDHNIIDPTLMKLPDGKWHVWYKDQKLGSVTMTAESPDLEHWKAEDKPAIGGSAHEGPKIFRFNNYYWMITDEWHGLRLYRSTDAKSWEKQGLLLDKPGKRPEDTPTGAHADVVVSGGHAYIIYFTHPGRKTHQDEGPLDKDGGYTYSSKRTSIHAAELEFQDGTLVCDRDKPFGFYLGDEK
ncbi:family 43 glycosylhydrolase [Mucilaginibacter pedocola]|uniref:Glycosyl hydrolase n=1 Tax=Mucilaginibacter pedocola TaxID=1792845 RepID=A0A1S9P6G8_9SPHI|nr:family 43 glycosylhydrolase [Mucilaginibacter pedocola]OOQ56550.1 glycosyl hydrolase [Mucilaginibacter pedocola]